MLSRTATVCHRQHHLSASHDQLLDILDGVGTLAVVQYSKQHERQLLDILAGVGIVEVVHKVATGASSGSL